MLFILKNHTLLFVSTLVVFAGLCQANQSLRLAKTCTDFCNLGPLECRGDYRASCNQTPFLHIEPTCWQNRAGLIGRECNDEEQKACNLHMKAFRNTYSLRSDGRRGVFVCKCNIDTKDAIRNQVTKTEHATNGALLSKCVYKFSNTQEPGPVKNDKGELLDSGSFRTEDSDCILDVSNIWCQQAERDNQCMLNKNMPICNSEESIKKYFGCITKGTMNDLRIIYKDNLDEKKLLYPPCK